MIINLLLNLIVGVIGVIFSVLPTVEKLPSIAGYDIDSAMVSGMGYFNSVIAVWWPFGIILQGALFIMSYYGIKLSLKFLIGHRTPTK